MTLSATAQPDSTPPKMYKPAELVKTFSIPRDLVYEEIKAGRLPSYNMGSAKRSRLLVSLEDFRAWLETRRTGNK
ncbi:helix-turn-helix domain-containing protein [Deinococcus sp.]|uniref:helix-turn-helix domain-containing protein n=1 Tax=Deinococcus sp. TaxID=47478 RepID=UPI003C7DFABB